MTKAELNAVRELKRRINPTDRRQAREEAWADLQDLAEKHGYGSRFCSLDRGLEWLMSSQDLKVRMKAVKLYGNYCSTVSNLETADFIGKQLSEVAGA